MFTMYLALRWLIGLSFSMWVALCCIDFCYGRSKRNQQKGFSVNIFKLENTNNTVSQAIDNFNRKNAVSQKYQDTTLLHYAMFFAGAFAVAVFNRKREIMICIKNNLIHIHFCATNFLRDSCKLRSTAIKVSFAIAEYSFTFWEYWKHVISNYLSQRKSFKRYHRINLELMKKLREYKEERKNLGQFLISAIRENKNIRLQYQMETIAKNRLLRQIEDTQQQIKENRSKYNTFQQLYLVTHQENIFLKARVKKLCKEKKEAERNLVDLVNEVYKSNNTVLKAYCSRFMVGTRENLLSCDVNAEIQKFMQRSVTPSVSCQDIFNYFNIEADIRMTENQSDEGNITPLTSNAPKLKGLPGECVWTVKDKDGIIEKLYEYDCETDFDNGDTIRRIRNYSVYCDKDCLLDFENSKTTLREISSRTITLQREQYLKVEYPLINNRFLTGSQAFQNFLQDNENLVHLPAAQTSALLKG